MTQHDRYELMMQMLDAYDEFRKKFLEITGTIVNSGNATKEIGRMAKAVGEAYNRLNNAAFDFVEKGESYFDRDLPSAEELFKMPGMKYGDEVEIEIKEEDM